jgi:flagellar basal-body rod protein FlgB
MLDRIANHVSFYQNAMNLRTQRQELLASNIANADTPHFKARDMDFKSAMANAQGRPGAVEPLSLMRTQAGHIAAEGDISGLGAIKYRAEYQGAVDGNTVNMDVERASFTENALQVEALITFINRRFSGLETAIKGQ